MPSAGWEPSQPRNTHTIANTQKNCRNSGRKAPERTFEVSSHGRKNRMAIAPNIAITPPSFDGTARRIA